MYKLPEFNQKIHPVKYCKAVIHALCKRAGLFDRVKEKTLTVLKDRGLWLGVLLLVLFIILGSYNGIFSLDYIEGQFQSLVQRIQIAPAVNLNQAPETGPYKSDIAYEQAIIDTVKSASPSVVSIVISKNLPVYEQQWVDPFGDLGPGFNIQIPQYVQKGTQNQEVGAGSGFIVSSDGFVLTNKHVVQDTSADYTVLTNDGNKYSAKVLALDPAQDLAVIKIQGAEGKNFPAIKLGDSSGVQIGQGVVAIGNALGQFSNTVSSGIVSGLQRTISASDQGGGFSETLEGVIQTDAAINAGNSGGPLLNLKGEVIGINVAMAQGAQNIGFAIPVNTAKRDIDQVAKTNKIVYPFLGVRYVLIDPEVKQKYKLSVDDGALVLKGANGEAAITPGSAADKAGIKANDIILEINGEKISKTDPMSQIILKYNPGDKITLKLLRNGKEMAVDATLGERSSAQDEIHR